MPTSSRFPIKKPQHKDSPIQVVVKRVALEVAMLRLLLCLAAILPAILAQGTPSTDLFFMKREGFHKKFEIYASIVSDTFIWKIEIAIVRKE